MARLPFRDAEDLAEADRELLARPINLYRVLVNSHEGLRHFRPLGRWIRHGSTIDSRLREMAILQVGYVARAAYEWSHHIKIGRDFGVTDDDVRAIIAESEGRDSGLPDLDRAVLRAAREMTRDLRASDETFATLKRAFNHDELVQLLLVIAHYNAVVRILETLEIDVEPEYQPYLDQFPLPE